MEGCPRGQTEYLHKPRLGLPISQGPRRTHSTTLTCCEELVHAQREAEKAHGGPMVGGAEDEMRGDIPAEAARQETRGEFLLPPPVAQFRLRWPGGSPPAWERASALPSLRIPRLISPGSTLPDKPEAMFRLARTLVTRPPEMSPHRLERSFSPLMLETRPVFASSARFLGEEKNFESHWGPGQGRILYARGWRWGPWGAPFSPLFCVPELGPACRWPLHALSVSRRQAGIYQ